MEKILKCVFKKTFHNPNARASSNYSVVEELAQTPCDMLTLWVLQSFPSQCDALLLVIDSMDYVSLIAKFNLSDIKLHLHYHMSFSIDVVDGRKPLDEK